MDYTTLPTMIDELGRCEHRKLEALARRDKIESEIKRNSAWLQIEKARLDEEMDNLRTQWLERNVHLLAAHRDALAECAIAHDDAMRAAADLDGLLR